MATKVQVLEARIRELERTMDYERKANNEAVKQLYRRDRRIKELELESNEYKNSLKDVQTRVQDLESELRIYKRKMEESQEICSNNANRFRVIHQKYLEECGKTEEYEEAIRRRRAVQQKTPLFYQDKK